LVLLNSLKVGKDLISPIPRLAYILTQIMILGQQFHFLLIFKIYKFEILA